MITADQLIMHAIGDYLLQSDWMANEKTKRFIPAAAHALVYSLGFLLFRPSIMAWLVICVSHFFIDRYRLARYVVWVKNFLAPVYWTRLKLTDQPSWAECSKTGYPPDRPDWLAVWLLIAADNILHVVINGMALRFL